MAQLGNIGEAIADFCNTCCAFTKYPLDNTSFIRTKILFNLSATRWRQHYRMIILLKGAYFDFECGGK